MSTDSSGQSVVGDRQGRADQGDGGAGLVSCPNDSTGDESAGGQSASTSRGRRRVRWTASTNSPIPRRRKTALFVRLSRGWVLDHVREVVLRQTGETTSRLDAGATAGDVPAWVLDEAGLRREDFSDATGGACRRE